MKYYLIGKRMKEWYGFDGLKRHDYFYRYDLSQKYFVSYFYEKYNINKLIYDYKMNILDFETIHCPKLKTIEEYRNNKKYDMLFYRNEVIKVIETEAEINMDSSIQIDDNKYKPIEIIFNTKLNRWEIYIDFIFDRYIKADKEYLEKCKENIEEVNNIIKNYNIGLKKLEDKHKKEVQENKLKEDNRLINRIRRLFK